MSQPTGNSSKNTKGWRDHQVGPEQAGWTVEAILTGPLQISKRRIQKLTRVRGIRLNRRSTYLNQVVQAGDVVGVRSLDRPPPLAPVPMELDILYEDEQLIAVNKPGGLLVHPTRPDQQRTLAHGLVHHAQTQGIVQGIHPVHRLDRDTSGVVLIAKSPQIQAQLSQQIQSRSLRREYLALIEGVVDRETERIEAPIGKHPGHPHLRQVRSDGDPARTHLQVLERFPYATLVKLELETGRTHQIRVHLQHRGHPVIGDRQYGGQGSDQIDRQALHACQLICRHPLQGTELILKAPLPGDLAHLLDHYRGLARS